MGVVTRRVQPRIIATAKQPQEGKKETPVCRGGSLGVHLLSGRFLTKGDVAEQVGVGLPGLGPFHCIWAPRQE